MFCVLLNSLGGTGLMFSADKASKSVSAFPLKIKLKAQDTKCLLLSTRKKL